MRAIKVGDQVRVVRKTIYQDFRSVRTNDGADLENKIGIVKRVDSRSGPGIVAVKFPEIKDDYGWAFAITDVQKITEEEFLTEEDFII